MLAGRTLAMAEGSAALAARELAITEDLEEENQQMR